MRAGVRTPKPTNLVDLYKPSAQEAETGFPGQAASQTSQLVRSGFKLRDPALIVTVRAIKKDTQCQLGLHIHTCHTWAPTHLETKKFQSENPVSEIFQTFSTTMKPQVENSILWSSCFMHNLIKYYMKWPSGCMYKLCLKQVNFMFNLSLIPKISY